MQIQHLTYSAMQALGYDPAGYENKIIAKDDDARKGFHSEETQKSYINDQNANNTEELVLIAGHEMSHAVDDKTGDVNRYSEQDREIYANNIGEDFTDYTDTALGVTGNGSMASRNSHVGNTGSTVVGNNQAYKRLDKSQGDNLIPLVIPAAVAITSITAAAIADPKMQQVTQQALTDAMAGAKEVGNGILNFFEPDAQYTDEELDIAAKAYLQMQEYRDSSTETGDWVEMDNLMQQVSAEVVARAHTMSAQNKEIAETIPMPSGSEIVEGTSTVLTNPVGESIDASSVTVADKDQGMWTTETPADHGVDVPLVVTVENSSGDEVKYAPTDKHRKGGWGTEMDLDDNIAQDVLNNSIQGGKQRYGYYDGKLYEFQADNQGGWHGYPIKGTEAPPSVLKELRDSGEFSNAEYKKLIKGK
ncbi:hypothetical protein [Vibrio gazogenes]|uniref:Uncharacterized protein n=1 Tax=Vibrio gazogenes TaxID=687 RepID=A0A1Z2SLB8_VIBGA|nr:hypothetical protein [Vibrio gazogenes]ASA57897.1 hypothetical protein BSQ33_19485 [Vibrio gazogenes]